jgi:uncharacterized membrane-anchored protein YhcB (DUF1043 family)
MQWAILIVFGIFAMSLIIFLIVRNLKDQKELERELNNDYPKPLTEDGEIEIDELTKDVH